MKSKGILFSGAMVRAILDGRKISKKIYKKAYPNLSDNEVFSLRIANGITVDKKTGCWNWEKSHNLDGYGTMTINGRGELVPRVCYEIVWGKIPLGMQVLHDCDNPKCCNPDHLHLGTRFDNMRECYQRGRSNIKPVHFIGSKNPTAKLKESDIPEIRKRLQNGETQQSIANIYRVSQTAIWNVSSKREWAHVK
jgi:hypothetical protein